MDCFENNLAFLELHQPALHKRLRKFSPKTITSSKFIKNDVFVKGERFYGMDGKTACHAQARQFLSHPTHLSLTYKSKSYNGYYHQQAINNLNEKALNSEHYVKGKPYQTNLILLGTGLGFHLSFLQEQLNTKHIVIVEPNDEMLFHFLHHQDLKSLHAHCKRQAGSLSIIQPTSTANFSMLIKTLSASTGVGLFSELTLYRHYETPLFDDIFKQFKALRNKWVSAWGFFNDEFISINNSLKNQFHIDYFVAGKAKIPFPPAIIVGNGPSLDTQMESLKAQQDNVLIFSCGSALAPLLRAGIKPDFHVEMERSHFSAVVQQKWFTDSFCQNTPLICLNTVDTDITQHFSQTVGFLKANDIGANLLAKTKPSCEPLFHCNPTATNLGAASAIAMGFKKLIFIGCDFGFEQASHHHAKSSDYYENNSPLSEIAPKAELLVKGKGGAPIQTTRIFNLARESLEKLLQRHPEVKTINCSLGAEIKRSPFGSLEELANDELATRVGTHEVLNIIKREPAAKGSLCIDKVLSYYAKCALELKKHFNKALGGNDINRALTATIEHLLSTHFKESVHVLYSGTLKYLAIVIAGHLARLPQTEHSTYSSFAQHEVIRVLERAHEVLVNYIKENKHEV